MCSTRELDTVAVFHLRGITVQVCMYVCMYDVCMYACMHVCIVCMYVCSMYVCMYVRMYVCMHGIAIAPFTIVDLKCILYTYVTTCNRPYSRLSEYVIL